MARKPQKLRRIIIPVGRGRVFKTNLAGALYEAMRERGLLVTAWDIDRAPSLVRRIPEAQRPTSGSPRARQACLESCINAAVRGQEYAVVDVGADDLTLHQIQDKLPEMLDMLARTGVEVVALHVLGPDPDKDLAYFSVTVDSGVFHRQIVVLNHGLVADGNPNTAFAAVRRIVNSHVPRLPVHVIRALDDSVMKALWPQDPRKPMLSLSQLADEDSSTLEPLDCWVVQSFLSNEIDPIIDEIIAAPVVEDIAAE